MGSIDISIDRQVASLVINHPEKMNCLSMTMLQDLEKGIQQIMADKSVRVATIQGAGDRAFSTGANLKEFKALDKKATTEWIKLGNELFNAIESLPIPTVAIISGYALGGGFELALACDLRIVVNHATFSFPELKHGWIPGWGGLSRLKRLVGESRAKQLLFLGDQIDENKAMELGLVYKIFNPDAAENEIATIIKSLSAIDPFVMEMTKSALQNSNRGTSGNDLLFDVLATHYSKGQNQ